MSDTSQWYYTDKTGQQAGPISTAELQKLASSKTIPSTSLVWKNGMPDWKPLSQVQELMVSESSPVSSRPAPEESVSTVTDPVAEEASSASINPYEAPTVSSEEQQFSYETARYGGVGRLAYFLYSILASIALEGGKFALGLTPGGESAGQETGILIFGLVSIVISIALMFARFKNIGMSRWWAFGFLVPILNIFVSIWLISRQEGWVESRQLDTAGKVIAWICWGLIAIIIIAVVGMVFFAYQAASAPQTSMLSHLFSF